MNRLKLLRKEAKKTQEEIANFINTTQTTYSRYEAEMSEPTLETLIKLADYYKVSLDYLIGRNYKNELGYLTEQQTMVIQGYLKLNPQNQRNVEIFILNTLAKQN